MTKTRIGFFLPTATKLFYPKEGIEVTGGAEINLYYLACELARRESFDVTFYVSDDGQAKETKHKGIRVCKVKHLNTRNGRMISLRRKCYLFLTTFGFKEDVMITTTASEHLGFLVAIHQELKGKKVIFRMAHDYNLDFEHYLPKGKRFYRLYKYGLNHVAGIVAQTVYQANNLEAMGLESRVIKNGFPISDQITGKRDIILWVARAHEMKRPSMYLELARRCPEHKFVMVMPENTSKTSRALKKALVVQSEEIDNLEIIDYIPPAEIQGWYDRAILFVNTSSAEGFPNTFIQSGLAKTPILSFAINPDGIFDRYHLGYFCEDDMERAVAFIKKLDAKAVQLYGSESWRYVSEHHRIELIADQYIELIKECL